MKNFITTITGLSVTCVLFVAVTFPMISDRMGSKLPNDPMVAPAGFIKSVAGHVGTMDVSQVYEIQANFEKAHACIDEVLHIKTMIDAIEPKIAPQTEYIGEFYLTMYACTIEQCGSTSGITASGRYCTDDPTCWTVAVDPSVIPLGTYLMIEDYPGIIFRADDTGSAVQGNMIDIYTPSEAESKSFPCHGGVKVWIIVD